MFSAGMWIAVYLAFLIVFAILEDMPDEQYTVSKTVTKKKSDKYVYHKGDCA